MKEEFENISLIRNEIMRQFEMVVEGKKAIIEYEYRDGKMFLTHAEVPESVQGRGIGEALTEKTFRYLEEQKIALVPACSFVKSYLRTHPEWKRILATGIQVN